MKSIKKHGKPDPVYIVNEPLYTASLALSVAAGDIDGRNGLNKFGKATDVDATRTDIWDRANTTDAQPVWLAPTASRIHTISSTNIQDSDSGGVNPAGTGARKIVVVGLDGNWNDQSETVTLDGTTGVLTTKSYRRIFRMYVIAAGSSAGNVGSIKATAAVDGTVTAQIQPTNNQTLMAIYTVPANHTFFCFEYYAAFAAAVGASALADVSFRTRESTGNVWRLRHTLGLSSSGTSYWMHRFQYPLSIPEKTDVKVTATGGSVNQQVNAGFQGVVISNG